MHLIDNFLRNKDKFVRISLFLLNITLLNIIILLVCTNARLFLNVYDDQKRKYSLYIFYTIWILTKSERLLPFSRRLKINFKNTNINICFKTLTFLYGSDLARNCCLSVLYNVYCRDQFTICFIMLISIENNLEKVKMFSCSESEETNLDQGIRGKLPQL